MPEEISTWDQAVTPTPDPVGEPSAPVVEPEPIAAEAQTTEPQTPVVEPSGDVTREAGQEQGAQQPDPLEQEEQERAAKEGPNWAIKEYRKQVKTIKGLEPYADIGRAYLDPTKSGQEVNDHIYQLSQTRYGEIANDMRTTHWEQWVQARYGKSDAELQELATTPPPAQPPASVSDQLTYAREILADTENRFTDADKAMATQFVQMQERLDAVPKLEGRLNEFETKAQEQARTARETQAAEINNGLYDAVWAEGVAAGLKEKGLEVNEKDSPEVAALKKTLSYLVVGEVWPTFDADEDNKKAVSRAKEFGDRLERDNAFREKDGLVVRARSAFERVWDSPEAQGLRSVLKIITDLQAQKLDNRGKDNPQINAHPAAGVTSQTRPQTWEQALAG